MDAAGRRGQYHRMRARRHHSSGSARPHRALVLYALGWLAAAAAVVLALVVALREQPSDEVSLPPVRHGALLGATRAADCRLEKAGAGERLDPPVSGASSTGPARGDFYDRAPAGDALLAALRRGSIVIHARPGIDDERLDQLRRLQQSFPRATIVVANDADAPDTVVATAYRRVLACDRLTDSSFDALRLFQGRFVGTGPDARP